MPHFLAVAKSLSGETQQLTRETESRGALLAALRAEGLTPVSVEEVASRGVDLDWGALFGRKGARKPRRKDLQAFMANFATLLRSGMDLERCLRTLEQESREPLRGALGEVSSRVRAGESLSESMAKTGIFDAFHLRVVRAGEFGGDLGRALSRIATTIDREAEVRGRVRNAIAYPAFLVVFGSLSFLVMLLFVLPKFSSIYEEMDAELPTMTKLMLGGSSLLTAHAFWLFPVLGIGGFLAGRHLLRFRENARLDRLRLRLPLLGPLIRDVEVSAFMRSLGLLLQSGLPVTQALSLAAKVANSAVFGEAIRQIEHGVQRGAKVSAEMRRQGLFSETILNLVAVGEESGRLEELLLETSEEMEKKMDQLVKGVLSLLEPVLILAVGTLIGLMVMATLLPIFSLSSGLRR